MITKPAKLVTKIDSYRSPSRETRRCEYWWFDAWDWLVNQIISLFGSPRIRVNKNEVAVDPHIHTLFSHCSISRPEDILLRSASLGLGAVAIMDHNEVCGVKDVMRCADEMKRQGLLPEEFLVIPGTEVNSRAGHIGALFIDEPIPRGESVEETVRIIHDAGGLAVAVHPYLSSGIGDAVFDAPFDAVEIECGSAFSRGPIGKNRDLGSDPRLASVTKLGSSDAHYVSAVANCYTILKMESPTLESARNAITGGCAAARASAPHQTLQKLLGGISKLQ